jgi:hypothetical protein
MIYIIPFDLLLDAEMNGVVRSNIIDIRLEGLVFKWVRQIDVHVERPAAEKTLATTALFVSELLANQIVVLTSNRCS